jgi:cell division transport system permease protein
MMSKLTFLLIESVRALFRARVPAIISSITIAITLVVFSSAYFFYENMVGFTNKFTAQFNIEVFFDSELSEKRSVQLFNDILLIRGIEQGEFIDKEKAASLFKRYFKDDINNIIGNNPLPMGGNFDISISHRSPGMMSKITREIRGMGGVDEAAFQHDVVSRVDRIIDNLLGFSIVVGIAILLISIILVSNTIRLIIHAKQHSIETLHLLGATNSFIRFPFIMEGIYQGLIGSSMALLFLSLLYSLQAYLIESLVRIHLVIPDMMIAGNLLVGILLGLTGSYRGISKYLK